MTISSTNTKNSYSGDGTTVAFSYTFKILDDDDIQVILRTDATGTETVQTKTTHYTVSGVGNAGGGTITFVSAPAATETVVLLRNVPLTQTTDYTPNDPFPAATHEDALDKLTLMAQDTQEEVDRSIKLSRTNTMTSTEFTVGAATRANKIFAFDSSGELAVTQEIGTFQGDWAASAAYAERDLVKDTSTNNIFIVNSAHTSSGSQPLTTNTNSSKYDLIVDAAAATTSATNAASSATAAAASATAAAASESAAATSETNAAASEAGVAADAAAAAASAASASTSATNASTSETNASNSASAASTSATNAATSATSASNSASAAGTSESNAATSATNASNSASAAATSASNAATSESNASTSETNAASSASSAASDASAAATSAAAAAASFDAFDDIYLGAKASAPTQDNDGDALTNGDLYFDTGDNELYIWNGSAWQAASPNIVADTTPQLGGDLDLNSNDITGTGNINMAGNVTADGLRLGDGDYAAFGDGLDLQISHSGAGSFIIDAGTGDLHIRADNNLLIQDAAGSTNRVTVNASGIDVTGTVTAETSSTGEFNGITIHQATNSSGDEARIQFKRTTDAGSNREVAAIVADRVGGNDTALVFETNTDGSDGATERVRINQDGNVGIGESNPSLGGSANGLHITGASGNDGVLKLDSSDATHSGKIQFTENGTDQWRIAYDPTNNHLEFTESGVADRMVIADGGNVGIGTSSPASTSALQVFSGSAGRSVFRHSGGDGGITVTGSGATSGAAVVLGNTWDNDSGSNFVEEWRMMMDGSDDSLQFKYNANANEAMRILSSGALCIGKTSTSTAVNGAVFQAGQLSSVTRDGAVFRIRRLTSDGTLIEFYQDTGLEGSIGVSGTTVSYNGGHLSRWSQLADNTKDTSIVKGTVMTNLDQMAVWHHEAQSATYYEEGDELPEGVSVGDEKTPAVAAYDEDNEQLNCMAVSSVEGDANVAGVFVNWDDDDDFNDMNVAMTGDMVIRIASGTTVARGDLLMSAGDGTAKPQGDDIVRSKTIAKVTSTTVSHTYDDGSYLVPCVLMAC